MVEPRAEAWHDIVRRTQDAGADGIELNFGCPHGMSERGMGSAVGQVPDYTCMIVEWVKAAADIPVMVKLTPNVTDVRVIGRAAKKGGADALSLINTINSIVGVDLDTLAPKPAVRGRGSHGGYCGPAVKPIALNMVSEIARDRDIGLPISGIGGIQAWQDAVEFMLLGSGCVQVCTAVMHYGFRIVEHLISGMQGWMREKGYARVDDFVGLSSPRDWRVERSGSQLQGGGRDRPGQVHPLRIVLHRLRGRLPPIHRLGKGAGRQLPGPQRRQGRTASFGRADGGGRCGRRCRQHLHDQPGHLRRVQHVLAGLSGQRLHSHAGSGHGQAVDDLA
jgi:dihydroorotate dehydrogenase subfamily 1